MKTFTRVDRLNQTWMFLRQAVLNYQGIGDEPRDEVHGQRALDLLSQMLREFGTDLDEAIKLASEAHESVNVSRTQKVSQFHSVRVERINQELAAIDDASDSDAYSENDVFEQAEIQNKRRGLQYQRDVHKAGMDRRAHGLTLTKMRSRSRA